MTMGTHSEYGGAVPLEQESSIAEAVSPVRRRRREAHVDVELRTFEIVPINLYPCRSGLAALGLFQRLIGPHSGRHPGNHPSAVHSMGRSRIWTAQIEVTLGVRVIEHVPLALRRIRQAPVSLGPEGLVGGVGVDDGIVGRVLPAGRSSGEPRAATTMWAVGGPEVPALRAAVK